MIVYGSNLSPFVRKVLVVAHEKGIAIDLQAGGMGGGGPDFREASPFLKMPALRDPGADGGADFLLCDSTAICAYLDARVPAPALIPAGAIPRARATWYEEFGDTILVPACVKMFRNRFVLPKVMKRPGNAAEADAAERDELPPLLDYLERVIPADGFLVGGALSVADVAVASPFVNLAHVGVGVDAARWPGVARYLAALHARPSFAAARVREDHVIARIG